MAESRNGAGVDWAIAAVRFRAIVTRDLPKVRNGYRVEAVEALRDETLAFVGDWDAQIHAAMGAGAAELRSLEDRLEHTDAALEEVTRRLLVLEGERDAARAIVGDLETELTELRNRPDGFDQAGTQIAVLLREASAMHQEASDEARAIRQEALDAAGTIRAEAERVAGATLDEAAELERESRKQAEEILEFARREASALVESAREQIELLESVDLDLPTEVDFGVIRSLPPRLDAGPSRWRRSAD